MVQRQLACLMKKKKQTSLVCRGSYSDIHRSSSQFLLQRSNDTMVTFIRQVVFLPDEGDHSVIETLQ